MLAITYDGSSTEIQGSILDLRSLSQALRACNDECQILLDALTSTEEHTTIHILQLSVEEGPMAISRKSDQLVFSGGRESFLLLAENIEWLADNKDRENNHLHIEYYPGHFFLAKGALPLIVACNA